MQTADVTGSTALNYLQNRGSKHFMAVALFVSVCAHVLCVSPRLMDLLEMVSGIYYHV